jgi:hypothetical protein
MSLGATIATNPSGIVMRRTMVVAASASMDFVSTFSPRIALWSTSK